jgi:hypothetical protein
LWQPGHRGPFSKVSYQYSLDIMYQKLLSWQYLLIESEISDLIDSAMNCSQCYKLNT